ncbi:hypothetical protein K7X08_015321 [Anisodus acutangulus]|uniref:Uncharacterized protein n=1 Tax=Anisodus acutangulus TaxID=402998 RepID=A0A9Q1L3X2_9SOLA|nr:hypothetical protein K7X08_015321 [Anisodus acutangulus]
MDSCRKLKPSQPKTNGDGEGSTATVLEQAHEGRTQAPIAQRGKEDPSKAPDKVQKERVKNKPVHNVPSTSMVTGEGGKKNYVQALSGNKDASTQSTGGILNGGAAEDVKHLFSTCPWTRGI